MIQPDSTTDAAPPERGCKGIIFLAGAIKYWWLTQCQRCNAILPEDSEVCTLCNSSSVFPLWGSESHDLYVAWRDHVRGLLIDNGYLTYAPHEAFKGTWDEKAQPINDAAIAASNLMLVLSPPGAITVGTDAEVVFATRVGTPSLYSPPFVCRDSVLLENIERKRS